MTQDKSKGFAELFAEAEQKAPKQRSTPKVGDRVEGRIVAIRGESVFVDLGAKAEGILDRDELLDEAGELSVKEGDTIAANVVDTRDDNLILRTKMGRGDGSAALQQAYEGGIPVTGKITGVNKGGVEVDLAGLRAFCPMSHLDIGRVDDPSVMVGQELDFRITKLESGPRPDVVVSRRAQLEAERAVEAAKTRAGLEVGSEVTGTVTRIKAFGAFVDIGGIEGLLHVSELDFARVAHPKDLLTEGESVRVRVTKIEQAKEEGKSERISLSRKALKDDPWDTVAQTLAIGAPVKGKVVRLEAFGAFIEIAPGLEGLVHVSQLSDRRIGHPREAVSVGDEIETVVTAVEPERRRVSLSVKGVAEQQEKAQAAGYQPASSGSLGTFADLLEKKLQK